MMKLKRFLRYFISVQAADPDSTLICFRVDEGDTTVQNVSFDVERNMWTVNLKKSR